MINEDSINFIHVSIERNIIRNSTNYQLLAIFYKVDIYLRVGASMMQSGLLIMSGLWPG